MRYTQACNRVIMANQVALQRMAVWSVGSLHTSPTMSQRFLILTLTLATGGNPNPNSNLKPNPNLQP